MAASRRRPIGKPRVPLLSAENKRAVPANVLIETPAPLTAHEEGPSGGSPRRAENIRIAARALSGENDASDFDKKIVIESDSAAVTVAYGD